MQTGALAISKRPRAERALLALLRGASGPVALFVGSQLIRAAPPELVRATNAELRRLALARDLGVRNPTAPFATLDEIALVTRLMGKRVFGEARWRFDHPDLDDAIRACTGALSAWRYVLALEAKSTMPHVPPPMRHGRVMVTARSHRAASF